MGGQAEGSPSLIVLPIGDSGALNGSEQWSIGLSCLGSVWLRVRYLRQRFGLPSDLNFAIPLSPHDIPRFN